MTYFVFGLGFIAGVFITLWVLIAMTIKFNKRRTELYGKATELWKKASELFETAKIWNAIGNKKDAAEALDEAARIALEAQKFEDEADGKKAP